MSKTKIWCCTKNNFIWHCTKSNLVSTKTCWCCTKKYFMSTKKSWCSTKKYFMSTKTRWCCIKKILCPRNSCYFFRTAPHSIHIWPQVRRHFQACKINYQGRIHGKMLGNISDCVKNTFLYFTASGNPEAGPAYEWYHGDIIPRVYLNLKSHQSAIFKT